MQYREFGRFGYRVSQLGFGAMRLPQNEDRKCDYEKSVPLLRRGIELGINYIDSAWGYLRGTSEVAIGKAIKSFPRQELFLSTKIPIRDQSGDEWRKQLETQLERLGTDYIDFHLMHDLRLNVFQEKASRAGGPLEAAHKAQDEGLIRHICYSSHDSPENIRKLIDTGEFAGMLVQYNLLDRANEEAIAYAQEKGMGVVIMGPVGGGRLGKPSPEIQKLLPGETRSSPEIALRFVFANPNVSLALSGMNTVEQVEENCATASIAEPLSEEEYQQVQEALAEKEKLADLYCTGCEYCLPCEQGVAIPTIFSLMNTYRLYGLKDYTRGQYKRLGPQNRRGQMAADACIECGQCEEKCPQNIPIIKQLKEAHKALS